MKFRHNSTIGVKKRKLDCGCFDYAFSKNKCKMHSTVDSTMKRMEKANEQIIEQEDLGSLIEDADAIFSTWVRLSASDKDGYFSCFICDKRVYYKDGENMHYIKRGASLWLRFDPRNNKAGCHECNSVKGGNYIEYAKKLELKSTGITDILYEEGNLVIKPTREEIRQVIAEYTPKVKELKKRLK